MQNGPATPPPEMEAVTPGTITPTLADRADGIRLRHIHYEAVRKHSSSSVALLNNVSDKLSDTRRSRTSKSFQCVLLVTPCFGRHCGDFTDRHAQIFPQPVCERSVDITSRRYTVQPSLTQGGDSTPMSVFPSSTHTSVNREMQQNATVSTAECTAEPEMRHSWTSSQAQSFQCSSFSVSR